MRIGSQSFTSLMHSGNEAFEVRAATARRVAALVSQFRLISRLPVESRARPRRVVRHAAGLSASTSTSGCCYEDEFEVGGGRAIEPTAHEAVGARGPHRSRRNRGQSDATAAFSLTLALFLQFRETKTAKLIFVYFL